MTLSTRDRTTREVTRLLARASRFNRLAKQAPHQHRSAFYVLKDTAVASAICTGDGQFAIDSIDRRPDLFLGVTHRPSRRRFHVRPYRLAGGAQIILHRLAARTGLTYPLLKWAEQRRSPAVAGALRGGLDR